VDVLPPLLLAFALILLIWLESIVDSVPPLLIALAPLELR